MSFWLLLTVNSITFGGLLFLLSAGFSLIFGLMRIPNLTHGSMFMVGAYLGTSFLSGALGFHAEFLDRRHSGRTGGCCARRADGAAVAAPPRRPAIGAGSGDARRVLHGRRSVPDGLGRRSDLGGDAGRAWRLRARRGRRVSALPHGGHRHRGRVRHRAVADARTHAARRHDPRRGRRSADGARGRHPRLAAVHDRVCDSAPGLPVLPA